MTGIVLTESINSVEGSSFGEEVSAAIRAFDKSPIDPKIEVFRRYMDDVYGSRTGNSINKGGRNSGVREASGQKIGNASHLAGVQSGSEEQSQIVTRCRIVLVSWSDRLPDLQLNSTLWST